MKPDVLATLLLVYAGAVCFWTVLAWALRRSWSAALPAGAAVGALAATAWFVGKLYPTQGLIAGLTGAFSASNLAAAGWGAAMALPWCVLPIVFARASKPTESDDESSKPQTTCRCARWWLSAGVLVASVAVTTGAGIALFNKSMQPEGKSLPPASADDVRLRVDHIATVKGSPVRIAVDDEGVVFVTFTQDRGDGREWGGIERLTFDAETNQYKQRVVARASVLDRSYGLAVRDGDLYVSRAGRFATTSHGRVTYLETGAVTRLRDLDGDGQFEHYHDVVTGLPGSQGPAVDHQNNAIVFSPDGSLYIAVGVGSDRTPGAHEWEGTILKSDPQFTSVEVFASGFRNPFGVTFGPEGQLIVSDNDWQTAGDEINHVERGKHYGHPYVVGDAGDRDDGFTPPILLAAPESNLLGVAYTESSKLPDDMRRCLYVVDYFKQNVVRYPVTLADGRMSLGEGKACAKVPRPVDIAVGPDGDLFVLSRMGGVYRIRVK